MAVSSEKFVNQRFFVTGASGFIASALIPELIAGGATVFGLVHQSTPRLNIQSDRLHLVYSVQEMKIVLTREEVDQIDTVIHLAGAGIGDWPWTSRRKAVLMSSRWALIDRLHQSLKDAGIGFGRVMGASAVGYYGNGGDTLLNESSPQGRGFAAELCAGIEQRLARAGQEQHVPWYGLRIGVVLGANGGVLQRLALPGRLGIGITDGQQWMSWIDQADVVGALLHVCQNDLVSGPVNLTSPEPVQWVTFNRALAGVFGQKVRFCVPSLMLRPLGEMRSLFLDSVKVQPQALIASGYEFSRPHLSQSLKVQLKRELL